MRRYEHGRSVGNSNRPGAHRGRPGGSTDRFGGTGLSGGAGLVLAAALLWGTVGPAQVLADAPMSPAGLGGWRLLVGGAALALLARRGLRGLGPALRRGMARPLLVCAASTGLYQAAFLYAAARTGAALATVVALGAGPVATGLIARTVTGERLTRTWLVSTAGAVAGCALLLAPSGAGPDLLGLLAATASGICYGLYTVYAKQLAVDHPGVHLPAVSALALLLGAVPLAPWIATSAPSLGRPDALGLVAWLGLGTTAVAYWLFSAGLPATGAATVGTLSLAEPFVASFLGVVVLNEHLTARAAVGSVLILAGLVAACVPVRRTASRTVRGSSVAAAHEAAPLTAPATEATADA